MKHKLSIQKRLILPVVLLGIVALISNILSIFSIHNVNANAANIVDNYMVGEAMLAGIHQSVMNIHKLALSHIVATDYSTMIKVVGQIKEEERGLDIQMAEYETYVIRTASYQELLENYDSFKDSLIRLVCASADSKTQDAYALANGDVARFAEAIERDIDDLYESITSRAANARTRLMAVYITSLIISALSIVTGILLILAALRIIARYVVAPIRGAIRSLHGSSERIDDVVGEVLDRTRTSNESTGELSQLAGNLSAAIQEVAGSASSINGSAERVRGDVNDMAETCAALMEYSIAMRTRADEMQRSAQTTMEVISAKASEILSVLSEAIEQSKSVDQIQILTTDIMGISSSTNLIALNASVEAAHAGHAGESFSVIVNEIRRLSRSCADTAGHIQSINETVTGVVHSLSGHAQDLVDYLNDSVLTEFEEFVRSGKQYHEDAAYIEKAMEEFNGRAFSLRSSMEEITDSIGTITKSMDDSAAGVTGVADSARSLAADMEDITGRMDINQQIVTELRGQTEMLANM